MTGPEDNAGHPPPMDPNFADNLLSDAADWVPPELMELPDLPLNADPAMVGVQPVPDASQNEAELVAASPDLCSESSLPVEADLEPELSAPLVLTAAVTRLAGNTAAPEPTELDLASDLLIEEAAASTPLPAAILISEPPASIVPPVPDVETVPKEGAGLSLEAALASVQDDVTDEMSFMAPGPGHQESKTGTADRHQRYVLFSLGTTDCAVRLDHVQQVERPQLVTPVPNVPAWMVGVTNNRGDVISLVDLEGFLGLPRDSQTTPSYMLLVQNRRRDLSTGLLVQKVRGIRSLVFPEESTVTAPLNGRMAQYSECLTEWEDRVMMLLDLENLLESPELRQFQAAGPA